MRNIKYFWLKRYNILFGIIFTVPIPLLTYFWLSGKLALDSKFEHLNAWSNPGYLTFPIAICSLFFIAGAISLLYVFLKLDIDKVLPRNVP